MWEGRVVSWQGDDDNFGHDDHDNHGNDDDNHGNDDDNHAIMIMIMMLTRLPNYALHAPTELKARQKKK